MNRTYGCITTFNKPYYEEMAHYMIETYDKFWPKDINLYAYLEDFKLPIVSSNIVTYDIFEKCNPDLQSFLDWRGQHFTRGFSFKAYTFINAARTMTEDVLIYLDADSITFRPIKKEFLDKVLPEDTLAAYMGVTMDKGKYKGTNLQNAETCIFFVNLKHPGANDFVNHYEHIYNSREIDDRERFRKPHDTWAFTECVQLAEKAGHKIHDLHSERKAHSPLKETMLAKYFRHFKAARKNDPNKGKYIDKITKGAEAKDLDAIEKKNKRSVNLKKTDLRWDKKTGTWIE